MRGPRGSRRNQVAASRASPPSAPTTTALDRARDVADSDPPAGFVARRLDDAEARIGRRIARTAARSGELYEPLTDRELAVLRRLPGTASRRDIGAALDLSINTVKAYTAALYRKLGVSSRQDAVAVARTLGLI
ncbi:helix-turn-helix transcriptional regulator [Pseudonocardia dioxanivorans]|uniref:helix-turn-helix transcriptional regulator n=1 Tax=Pseudonocardia dioxanivorans TaxID=240495 RepID=UPI000CD2A229|nr:LuxR C-terminal-related transcriptional regulator [Pseudonocardia dioxanivorans]